MNTPEPVGHEGRVKSLVPSHDSKWMVTASQDGSIIVWDTESGAIVHEWLAHWQGLWDDEYALALSPDSRRLASVGVSNNGQTRTQIKVWDIDNGIRRADAPEAYANHVIACAWSPDGALVASASDESKVHVWDALASQQRDLIADAGFRIGHLQFSPDARYLAWSSFLSPVCFCNVWFCPEDQPTGRPRLVHLNCGISIHALSFNPKSTRIVTAHGDRYGEPEDYVVRVWDIATRTVLAVLAGHTASVGSASFSPDGRSILSTQASPDGPAKIWSAESWEETLSFKEDEEMFRTGCFSPNGKYVATLLGTRVQLWGVSDGLCLATFTEHKLRASHVAFSPNSEFLASADMDGIVHIRRLSNFI